MDVVPLVDGGEAFRESVPDCGAFAVTGGPADVTGSSSRLSPEVRRALDHMARNYSDPITLRDISQLTHRSPSQLIRAFHKELGITPHAWLIRLRVSHGMAMLTRGDSIATVAYEVGFVDQTHFTRHFKRVHGNTPGRFLNAARARRGIVAPLDAGVGNPA